MVLILHCRNGTIVREPGSILPEEKRFVFLNQDFSIEKFALLNRSGQEGMN